MSIPKLVEGFYERIWNSGDLEAVNELLSEDFIFRGSLDAEHRGRTEFVDYVRSVRDSLSNYRCEILECVTENKHAFAKMRFSGVHTAEFRGYSPTSLPIHWLGAALFRFEEDTIAELWVLDDLSRTRRPFTKKSRKQRKLKSAVRIRCNRTCATSRA